MCGCLFSQQLSTLTHALLTPSGRCALEQGCHDQVDSWDVGKIGIWTGRHAGGRAGVMLMEVTYIGSVSGEVLISDGGQTATADDSVCAQSP